MCPRGMFASCHGKEDVSVLAGPHLHTSTSLQFCARCVMGRC